MALTTQNSSGSQATTGNPQTSTGGLSGTTSGNLQPGVTGSELNSGAGTPLHNPPLPTVSLSAASQQTDTSPTIATAHHFNPLLLGLAILLLMIAMMSFWLTRRSGRQEYL
jgi:hypothetical protein